MLRLSKEEYEALRCQIGILKKGQHAKFLSYVFTQEGVAMLSSILRSQRAAFVNVLIMRAFVRLRELLATHRELAKKIEDLEHRVGAHDQHILKIFAKIRELLTPAPPPTELKRRIGYHPDLKSRGSI